MPQTKTCPQCGNVYSTKDPRQKYCSTNCSTASKSQQIECTCLTCGKKTMRQPAKVSDYCSKQCAGIGKKKRIPMECAFCGKPFDTVPNRKDERKYCSRLCQHAQRMAESREIRQCTVCGKEFQCYKVSEQFCCSPECGSISSRNRMTYVCKICGDQFDVSPSHSRGKNTYCSRKCAAKALSGPRIDREIRTCKTCGKEFEHLPRRSKGDYCSHDCRDYGWAEHLRRFIGKRGPTKPELAVMHGLYDLHINFEHEKRIGRFVIDFFCPSLDACIEVDGDYWHSLPGASERDARKDLDMERRGFCVIRISETEINETDSIPDLLVDRINSRWIRPA